MPDHIPAPRRLRSLCAEVHPDDGSDPREFFRKGSGRKGKARHKLHQLCRQVAEALDSALAGGLGDDVLLELAVVDVQPAPDASRLLVTVTPRASDRPPHPGPILAGLERASKRLRAEVASAITRKRAPLLAYRVVDYSTGGIRD